MAHPFVRFSRPMPIGGAALLLALVLVPRVLVADVDVNDRDRSQKGKKGGNAALQQQIDFALINVNSVLSIIDNRGIIAQDPRTSNGFGFFPANSPNNYEFGGGIWVGGIVNGTKIVSTGYDASGGFSEFNPGRAAVNGGGAEDILCSDNASDLANWYPEFSDPATGEPIVFSQKDCVVIYNDSNQSRDVGTPLGVEVRQRTMAFTFGALTQVIFVVWDVANVGGNTIQDAFIGINDDFDIGDQFRDDRCSAVPSVPPGNNNPTDQDVQTNLGFCWDDNFSETNFDPNPPGYVGITFFQGVVGDDGNRIGLTRFTLTTNPTTGRPQPDPSSDAEQYDLMGGIGTRAPFIDAVSADMRIVEISGPFTFEPGETQQLVMGLLWANAPPGTTSLEVSPTRCFPQGVPCFLPDPNDPKLRDIIRVQRAAQVIFDANFKAPAPPPKPDITLIPGDRKVTIVWSDVSQAPDPFFDIASDPKSAAFDPAFRQFDFEGFVLVRSTSGDPTAVDTLAEFDLVNDVTVIQDTTFQLFTVGDTVARLPTNIVTRIELNNEGLQFSFTDDNDGRGLINGLVYFYDVVPFDFNPSPTLSPEVGTSTPSLSAGIAFQPREVRSTRPRSDASSFREATTAISQIFSDGTIIDPKALEQPIQVDAKNQVLLSPVPPSNAVELTVNISRPEQLPDVPLFVVIDSVIPFDPSQLEGDTRFVASIGYHLEDASGNVVNSGAAAGPFFWDFAVGYSTLLPALPFPASLPEAVEQELILQVLGNVEASAARAGAIINPLDVSQSSLVASSVVKPENGGLGNGVRALGYFAALRAADIEVRWKSDTQATVVDVSNGVEIPCTGKTVDSFGFITTDVTTFADQRETVGIQDVSCTAVYKPTDDPESPAGSEDLDLYLVGAVFEINGITAHPSAGDVWRMRIAFGSDDVTTGVGVDDDGDGFLDESGRTPVRGQRFQLLFQAASNNPGEADLERIKTVPNPYVANAVWDFSQDNQRIEFINLPPQATIRIYTISGNLVRVLEHTNGSGTEVWDLRTRFNLKAASGTYYWLVTTPDGKKKLGLLSIIQNALGAG